MKFRNATLLKPFILLTLSLVTSALAAFPVLLDEPPTKFAKFLLFLPATISLATTLIVSERLSLPHVTSGKNACVVAGIILAGLLAIPITWILSFICILFHFTVGQLILPPMLTDMAILIYILAIYFVATWCFIGFVYERVYPESIDSSLSILLGIAAFSVFLISIGLFCLEEYVSPSQPTPGVPFSLPDISTRMTAAILFLYFAIPLNTLWIGLQHLVHDDR